VYVVDAVSAAVFVEPLTGSAPLQPPDALQEVALVDDHVIVELPPLEILLGLAVMVTVGAAEVTETVVDCAALAPDPVQVSL
jgi:hypothetical protein